MMVRRVLGVDPGEFEGALTALTSARSIEEIAALVDKYPIMTHQAFLAAYIKRYDSGDPGDSAIRAAYEPFLLVLHLRAHKKWCSEPFEPSSSPGPEPPEPYASVFRLVQGLTLTPLDQPFDASSELDDLATLLRDTLGRPVRLPQRTPSTARWNLGFVKCAGCDIERAICRAHLVDLAEVEPQLRAGAFEDPACPNCGDHRAKPQWLLLCDHPRVSDALAALCTVVRVAAGVYIYRPPSGTVDKPEGRQLLEKRMRLLPRDLGRQETPNSTSTHYIAYSHRELIQILDEEAAPPGPYPQPMRILITSLARQLRRREIGYTEVEEHIASLGQDAAGWPLIAADLATGFGSEDELLATALVAEKVAKLQNVPLDTRVSLAAITAIAYEMLHEFGAAERTIARAEDLLRETEPKNQQLQTLVEQKKAEIRLELGHAEQAREEPRTDLMPDTEDGRLLADLAELESDLRKGAYALRESRLVDALNLLPGLISSLDERLARMADNDPIRRAYEKKRCGAQGNLGGTLQQAANILANGITEARTTNEIPEAVAELCFALSPLFSGGFSPEDVREQAIALLEDGTKTAASIQVWDFAAAQGVMLIEALEDADRDPSEVAAAAVEWAARAGDHAQEAHLRFRLAAYALARKAPGTAVDELSSAAIASIRDCVGSGHRHLGPEFSQAFGNLLVLTAHAGADAERVAVVLENLKAATTAETLGTGFPVGEAPAELWSKRERLRLGLLQTPDAQILQSLTAVEEELNQARAAARLRDPLFLRWVDSTTLTLTDSKALRRRLADIGANTRYLGFFQTEDRIVAYLLDSSKTSLIVRPRTDLDGVKLASWLIKPFSRSLLRLSPDDRLIISVDLTMPPLPFAVARVGKSVLAERATLSFIQSAGVLDALSGHRRPRYATAVAVGAPTRPDLPELPTARWEATNVTTAFPGGELLLGPRATVPALRRALHDVDILHFACHAVTSGAADPYSRLCLAPHIVAGDSGDLSEDRIITELALPPGCFVNLAGCDTALQETRDGPLLGGLVPAFLVAGARAVLASVIPLPDEATSIFQTVFYRLLADLGSPVTALNRCQRLAYSGHLGKDLQDHHIWAGFVLYGG